MKKQTFTIRVTRKEFLTLPMPIRRRALAMAADNYIVVSARVELVTALDLMAVALSEHGHKWTKRERRAYEKAISVLHLK